MDRGAPYRLLTWMLLPVSAVLVFSALSLSRQPYTGVILRGDWVAGVDAGSPGARAGLAAGDRLLPTSEPLSRPSPSALSSATPGRPIRLLRERGAELRELSLIPVHLPDSERRIMAALLAVASGFVVIGGWVWSERRDRLTRTFFLLCLAFAWLLAPLPRWENVSASIAYDAIYSGITLFLPALFVHFFALFPESGRPRGPLRSMTAIAYGIATGLYAASMILALLPAVLRVRTEEPLGVLQGIAGLWFATGLATAMVLFLRSYRQANNDDARRRLRVVLVGTLLGVGPLAALVALRNLAPSAPIAGERYAVLLTLLVPASFAWATAVHRIFEFRVALRAAAVSASLALLGGAVYLLGEWLGAAWRHDLGAGIAGGALAFIAITSSVAAPAGNWFRSLGRQLFPESREPSLAEWQGREPHGRRGNARQIVATACEAMAGCLKLDGCAALECSLGEPKPIANVGAIPVPRLSPDFNFVALDSAGPLALDDAGLSPADRLALERAGVGWVLGVGESAPRTVFLLGHRLGGAWLALREQQEVESFARHLEVLIENASLRASASEHEALDRDLTRAHDIQAHLLPRRIPAYRSLDCAAAALSSQAVGGDYYDFIRGGDGVFTIAVGDAAGKGVPAALMGAWAQACFRTHARRGARPGHVLSALNRELVSLEQPQAFVALLCARIDVRSGTLSFANAGLTPPLLRRRDGSWQELTRSGVLLGVASGASYPDTTVQLDQGDLVVLYTDGLTEARRGDEMFGPEGVLRVLERHADRPAADIVHELLAASQAFSSAPPDDMTVVVLRQRLAPVQARKSTRQIALKWRQTAADATG